jgi:hypothetical protein
VLCLELHTLCLLDNPHATVNVYLVSLHGHTSFNEQPQTTSQTKEEKNQSRKTATHFPQFHALQQKNNI